jgi:hypothetical protein
MFLFTIKALPNIDGPNPSNFSRVAGAYVNAWIDFPEQEGAEALARFYVKQAGWKDGELDQEAIWIDDMDLQDESYQYYQEALECGSSLVFNTFPHIAPS